MMRISATPFVQIVLGLSLGAGLASAQRTLSLNVEATEIDHQLVITGEGCSPGTYRLPVRISVIPDSQCAVTIVSRPAGSVLPGRRSAFFAWSDGNIENPRLVTVNAALHLLADIRQQFLADAVIFPPGAGTLEGTGWVNVDVSTLVTAKPAAGFRFVRWEPVSQDVVLNERITENPRRFSVPLLYTGGLRAVFERIREPNLPAYSATPLFSKGLRFLDGRNLNNRGQVLAYQNGLVLFTPNSAGGAFNNVGTDSLPSWGTLNDRGDVLSREGHFLLGASRSPNWVFGLLPVRMNNLGWIAGVTGPTGEALWNGKEIVTSPRFAGSIDINDAGQVITKSGWLYGPPVPGGFGGSIGTFSRIGDISGYPFMTATVLSSVGVVSGQVCSSAAPDCPSQVFVWRPTQPNGFFGTFSLLPLPNGFVSMRAKAINRQGLIVGGMTSSTGLSVPFLFDGTRVYDLTDLAPSLLSYNSEAHGINDAGQILVGRVAGTWPPESSITEAVAYLLEPLPARTGSTIRVEIRHQPSEEIPSDLRSQPFTVTGVGCSAGRYTTPAELSWAPGAKCSVSFASERLLSPTFRVLFAGWSDGIAGPARDLQPTASLTLTVQFLPQVRPQIRYARNEGTIDGLDGWATVGSLVELTARPNPGFRFAAWSTPDRRTWPFNRLRTKVLLDEEISALFEAGDGVRPQYQLTPLGGLFPPSGRGLNNVGQVALNWASIPYLWQPRPGAPSAGDWSPLDGLRVDDGYQIADLSDSGELLLTRGRQVASLWRPNTPGSAQGTLQEVGEARLWTPYFQPDGRQGPFQSAGTFFELDAAGARSPLADFPLRNRTYYRRNRLGQTLVYDIDTGPAISAPTPTPPGPLISIPVPAGFRIFPIAINDLGQIIGSTCPATGVCTSQTAFLWTPSVPNGTTGSWKSLAGPPGNDVLIPTAINNRGHVVGQAGSGGVFLFDGSRVWILPATGRPNSINDQGQILVTDSPTTLLTPWTEPAPSPSGVPVTIATAEIAASGVRKPNALTTPFQVSGNGCAPGVYPAQTPLIWSVGAVCEVEFLADALRRDRSKSTFVRWSDGVISNRRRITVTAAATFTAEFANERLVEVVASPVEGGRVEGAGWLRTPTTVLTAIPAPGFRFLRWDHPARPATDANPMSIVTGLYGVVVAIFVPLDQQPAFTITRILKAKNPTATSLNAYGQIVTRPDDLHLFLWQPVEANSTQGNMRELTRPDARPFGPPAINDYGQIVTTKLYGEGLLWQPNQPNGDDGQFVRLPGASAPTAINSYGQAYRVMQDFIWTPAQPNTTTGSNLRFVSLHDYKIDDAGNVLVPYLAQYFRADPVSRELDPQPIPVPRQLAGLTEFAPMDIAPQGVIGGIACESSEQRPGCGSHVLIWDPSETTPDGACVKTIRLPAELTDFTLKAVNRRGQVIVNAISVAGTRRPIFFDGNHWVNLFQQSPEFVNATALGLNDSGQILIENFAEYIPEATLYLLTPDSTRTETRAVSPNTTQR